MNITGIIQFRKNVSIERKKETDRANKTKEINRSFYDRSLYMIEENRGLRSRKIVPGERTVENKSKRK